MGREAPPAGKVVLVTTYLEMLAPPARPPVCLPDPITMLAVTRVPIHYYRYLYDGVGAPWGWWERKRQTDAEILAELHAPGFQLYVPHFDGAPGGLIEIDARRPGDVQLNYFGLFPEHCGQGFGRLLLDWSVDLVFRNGPCRYWVHTCSLDSPAALRTYRGAGFVDYDEKTELIDDPRP